MRNRNYKRAKGVIMVSITRLTPSIKKKINLREMSTMIKVKKIYIIAAFILMIIFFISALKIDSQKGDKLRKEFPIIENADRIDGLVLKIKKIKGGCFITTDNNKFRLYSSQNYDYHDEYIHNNLFVGDSLFKKTLSDTIYIKSKARGSQFFVLERVINRYEKK